MTHGYIDKQKYNYMEIQTHGQTTHGHMTHEYIDTWTYYYMDIQTHGHTTHGHMTHGYIDTWTYYYMDIQTNGHIDTMVYLKYQANCTSQNKLYTSQKMDIYYCTTVLARTVPVRTSCTRPTVLARTTVLEQLYQLEQAVHYNYRLFKENLCDTFRYIDIQTHRHINVDIDIQAQICRHRHTGIDMQTQTYSHGHRKIDIDIYTQTCRHRHGHIDIDI